MAALLPILCTAPRLLHRHRRRPAVIYSSSATSPSPFFCSSPLTRDLDPPPVGVAKHMVVDYLATLDKKQQKRLPEQEDTHHHSSNSERDEFYLNLGTAVRTLRDDLPALFSRELNYDIYRDDITFADPLNTFHGIDNYRRIFWALRFHGRILFKEIGLDVLRICQLSDDVILIRWNLKGVPRVPWETRGQFQGTSRYKLDRHGRILEHRVDNLAFNFPKMAPAGSAAVLDLVTALACPPLASPNFTFHPGWDLVVDAAAYKCSWVEFYRAVKETIDQEHFVAGIQDRLVTCS